MTTPFTPAMARRIELWPLDRLKPYAKNARTHSDAQVAQIAASIAEFPPPITTTFFPTGTDPRRLYVRRKAIASVIPSASEPRSV